MKDGALGEVVLIGTAGLACGILWEFWNYWSMPKWEYTLPHLGFASVFEMPVLGYGGYVPFALFVVQAVALVDLLWPKVIRRSSTQPHSGDARSTAERKLPDDEIDELNGILEG